MAGSLIFGIAALFTLLPAAIFPVRRDAGAAGNGGALFWLLIGAATVGPIALEIAASGGTWRAGFSATLWTIIGSTMCLYFVLCLGSPTVRRLRGLLLPYLVLLGTIALLWSSVPDRTLPGTAMTAWLQVHIVVSLVTYAATTIAAMAALAVWLKERALRKHRTDAWVENLPAISDGERVQNRLLLAAEVVLGAGLLTGLATQFYTGQTLLPLDHKTLLSIAAFAVLGVLLLLHRLSGLRGRHAARIVLIGYLLITLAFPGVKFVTDVILA